MSTTNNNEKDIDWLYVRKWFFIFLASAFQIISLYSSFKGINKAFVSNPIFAFIFAFSLNLSLLGVWHQFQGEAQVSTEGKGYAKRRLLSLIVGSALLSMTIFMSSIGMYSVLGFETGKKADADVETSQALQQNKEVFNKVKDAAAKNLDAKMQDLSNKLDTANKRLSQTKAEKRRVALSEEIRQLEIKMKSANDEKDQLANHKPITDDKLTLEQKNSEIQAQISNLISKYGIERDKVLTTDDKKVLSSDRPIARDLYDQFILDVQNRKPLAISSIIFGTAPDVIAIALIFIGMPRRKLGEKIRALKAWIKEVREAIYSDVEFTSAEVAEVIVSDQYERPLLQTFIPLDLDEEITESLIRDYFPKITSNLRERFGRDYEIRVLPANWQEVLISGSTLELTAVEI